MKAKHVQNVVLSEADSRANITARAVAETMTAQVFAETGKLKSAALNPKRTLALSLIVSAIITVSMMLFSCAPEAQLTQRTDTQGTDTQSDYVKAQGTLQKLIDVKRYDKNIEFMDDMGDLMEKHELTQEYLDNATQKAEKFRSAMKTAEEELSQENIILSDPEAAAKYEAVKAACDKIDLKLQSNIEKILNAYGRYFIMSAQHTDELRALQNSGSSLEAIVKTAEFARQEATLLREINTSDTEFNEALMKWADTKDSLADAAELYAINVFSADTSFRDDFYKADDVESQALRNVLDLFGEPIGEAYDEFDKATIDLQDYLTSQIEAGK